MNENTATSAISKFDVSLFSLVLVYLLALIGLGLPALPALVYQLGGAIFIAFLVILSAHEGRKGSTALFIVLTYVLAWLAEWSNLRFGVLFGNLRLGPDWLGNLNELPFQQALAWTFSAYLAGMVSYVLQTQKAIYYWLFQAALILLLLTLIDKSSFLWDLPSENFTHIIFGRFLVSLFLSFLFTKIVMPDTNLVARRGYLATALFFAALAFVVK
jgi:hypothetical protein